MAVIKTYIVEKVLLNDKDHIELVLEDCNTNAIIFEGSKEHKEITENTDEVETAINERMFKVIGAEVILTGSDKFSFIFEKDFNDAPQTLGGEGTQN